MVQKVSVEQKQNSSKRQKLLIVAGATATGKSSLAIELAKKFNGEIISCDSAQIYQGLDVGTAKLSKEDMQGVEHHLMSFVPPTEQFSVSEFKMIAEQKIAEISSRGKLPILAGGTGLYIEAILNNYNFENALVDQEYRNKLQEILKEQNGKQKLYQMLCQKNIEKAKKIDMNNTRRVIRALEIEFMHQKAEEQNEQNQIAGKDKSLDNSGLINLKIKRKPLIFNKGMLSYDVKVRNVNTNEYSKEKLKNKDNLVFKNRPSKYDSFFCVIVEDRQTLYNRINARAQKMQSEGLYNEVCSLLNKGINFTHQSMSAIGYKEWQPLFQGQKSINDVIEQIKQNSRRYAKRQITWFKHRKGVREYALKDKQRLVCDIENWINS